MALVAGMIHLLKIEVMKILLPFCQRLLGTCQKFAGGRGGGLIRMGLIRREAYTCREKSLLGKGLLRGV